MGSYIVNTPEEQQRMLEDIGYKSFDELFSSIPESVRLRKLNLPPGKSELEVSRIVSSMAAKNHVYSQIFRGAGAYWHYIPSVVKSVVSKEEFLTAYTPYQAEISQGILQSIFEYQTMICELTGMDASNASVYDGATAAAEAAEMCVERKRKRILVSETAGDPVTSVIKTYAYGKGYEVAVVPAKDRLSDLTALRDALTDDTACFYQPSPNFYGNFEDMDAIAECVHASGAKLIMGCNPIALAVMKTPAEYGADIAVGEGQPLGLDLGFGGPYLGFMAATSKMMRKLPGRIVGRTTDGEGRTAYVLTLQAREQHIRREKAGSNICSNEALCALTAAVYLSAMGPDGLKETALQCHAKAAYLRDRLKEAGLAAPDAGPFFHEFVTESDIPSGEILQALDERDILGGLPLSDRKILWCATEMNTKEAIDLVAEIVGELISHKTSGCEGNPETPAACGESGDERKEALA